MEAAIEANPFPKEAKTDPGHLVMMFLKDGASEKDVRALQESITGREVVPGSGREVYVYFRDGIGKSRLTINVVERKLGTRATGRNWNTVLKLRVVAISLLRDVSAD